MYEKLLERVMSENVTLEDWKEYQACYDKLTSAQHETMATRIEWLKANRESFQKQRKEFVEAARHVVTILPMEYIMQDTALMVAYEELHHPEKFS